MLRNCLSLVYISIASLVLSACAGDPSPQVQAMQRKDKQLSCKEVLLEMNEAQFYKKMAQKNKDPKLKTVLMPLGYISTYMGADEAAETASARIDYLDKIYEIMDCDRVGSNAMYQQPVSSYGQPLTSNNAPYLGANYSTEYSTFKPVSANTASAPYRDEGVINLNQPSVASKKSW